MSTTNTPYTFTFDKKVGLSKDTEYVIAFFLAETGEEKGVNINVKSNVESPDLHVQGRDDLRPKVSVSFGKDGAYVKPTNGVPKSDLDSSVQKSLEKADASASHDETVLTETYGDIMDSEWKFVPGKIQGYDITMNLLEDAQGVKATPYANEGPLSMTPILLQGDEESLTWNPMGGETPFWFGDEPLVATRTGKYLLLGEQTEMKIQPKGDYLVPEDLQKVSAGKVSTNKISIANGGKLELNSGSTIQVNKGIDETKLVIVDGNERAEVSFPTKSGTLVVDEDLKQLQVGKLSTDKIAIQNGGQVELKSGSTIKVSKGFDETKIVLDDGETQKVLTFPAKAGTLVVDGDLSDFYTKPSGRIPESDLAQAVKNKLDGAYTKPSDGIPKSDLKQDVQDTLDGAYSKPTNGIPASDLEQSVQNTLNGAYSKPSNGIPESDLEQTVQTKLDGAYSKPSNGIPKSDLAQEVQTSLEKADDAPTSEDIELTETYGDIMDSTWDLNPSSFSGYALTLEFTQVGDLKKVDLYAGGGSATGGNPVTLQGDEETLTWYPSGSGQTPTWLGPMTVTATRTGKYIKLGDQTPKMQPAGNYATKDICVSKAALASVLDAVDAQTGTDDKFNTLITQLRNLVNA